MESHNLTRNLTCNLTRNVGIKAHNLTRSLTCNLTRNLIDKMDFKSSVMKLVGTCNLTRNVGGSGTGGGETPVHESGDFGYVWKDVVGVRVTGGRVEERSEICFGLARTHGVRQSTENWFGDVAHWTLRGTGDGDDRGAGVRCKLRTEGETCELPADCKKSWTRRFVG